MVNESRIDIYDYLYNLLFGVVSENVYDMRVPQELTESDTKDGFIVIHVGDFVDNSEFSCEAYGGVRCFIEAYIPQISRGRVNHDIYALMENGINNIIDEQSKVNEGTYYIDKGSVLTADDDETSNANNAFFTFIKSFIVVTDNQEEAPIHLGDLYIGLGGESIESVEELTEVQHYNTSNPKGDYSIEFANTQYLWLCSTGAIHEITSSGFEVPYDYVGKINDLYCYRSANSISEGVMNFTIEN